MLTVRSSPHIELKQLGALTAEEREPFLELERDPDFYGILLPRPPLTINLQAVSRRTAERFRAMSRPTRVDVLDDDDVDLILDAILEIETDDGFVFGADALPILAPCGLFEPRGVSHEALLHAQDLETSDAQQLITAFYLYNRIPMSPFWRARFPDAEALLTHLGADRGPLRRVIESGWSEARSMNGWVLWLPLAPMPQAGDDDPTYKLYVSPRPERIRDAFEIVVRVLASFPSTPFKIGDSAAGLLRPDKFVAYFATRAQLDDAAAALRSELAGCDAHGVPFTAALDDSGLLSWGIDPPESDRALAWLDRDSWRYRIAKRLGAAMSVAKLARTTAAVEPWRFAIERVRRQGVDVDTWSVA